MQLTKGQKLSFGVGAVGKDAVFNLVSIYFMFYVTNIIKLSPVFVEFLFLLQEYGMPSTIHLWG